MLGILGKLLLSLALIISLMTVLFYLMKRFHLPSELFRSPTANIKIYEKLQIQPKKAIYLVKVLNKILVLGISESSFTVLTEINDPEFVRALDEIYFSEDSKNGKLFKFKA